MEFSNIFSRLIDDKKVPIFRIVLYLEIYKLIITCENNNYFAKIHYWLGVCAKFEH